jgi:hypothetical protein
MPKRIRYDGMRGHGCIYRTNKALNLVKITAKEPEQSNLFHKSSLLPTDSAEEALFFFAVPCCAQYSAILQRYDITAQSKWVNPRCQDKKRQGQGELRTLW